MQAAASVPSVGEAVASLLEAAEVLSRRSDAWIDLRHVAGLPSLDEPPRSSPTLKRFGASRDARRPEKGWPIYKPAACASVGMEAARFVPAIRNDPDRVWRRCGADEHGYTGNMSEEEQGLERSRMGRPTRLASEALSKHILAVARDVFFSEGFGRTSAERIAELAAVSKRTLYARFRGKSALFEAVILTEIEDGLATLEASLPDFGDIRLELKALAEGLLSWMLTDVNVAMERVVIAEAARFPKLARNLYEFGFTRTTRLVAALLRRAEQRREVVLGDPDFAADHFVSSVILSPFRRAALGVGQARFDSAAAARMSRAVDLFMDGCLPRPLAEPDPQSARTR